jgi:arginine-tRNA-protein transferase
MAVDPALTFVGRAAPCVYLPVQTSQLRYELIPQLDADDYMHRLRAGWRRFGAVVFRPECPTCRMCQSLRVPVDTFRPSESQRRAWKKNEGAVTVRIGEPQISAEQQDLFDRFHQAQHEDKGWPVSDAADARMMADNPFPTEEWRYYLGERLIAVGYVDALPQGLSAIYFYYDPAERHRSLGTYNVLSILSAARERRLPHVYLGYYVAGYRSLEYKARFRPNEVLTPDGTWHPFDAGI